MNSNLQEVLDLEFELLHVGHAPMNKEDYGVGSCLRQEKALNITTLFNDWVELSIFVKFNINIIGSLCMFCNVFLKNKNGALCS